MENLILRGNNSENLDYCFFFLNKNKKYFLQVFLLFLMQKIYQTIIFTLMIIGPDYQFILQAAKMFFWGIFILKNPSLQDVIIFPIIGTLH